MKQAKAENKGASSWIYSLLLTEVKPVVVELAIDEAKIKSQITFVPTEGRLLLLCPFLHMVPSLDCFF